VGVHFLTEIAADFGAAEDVAEFAEPFARS
jgi:hypothetical protein